MKELIAKYNKEHSDLQLLKKRLNTTQSELEEQKQNRFADRKERQTDIYDEYEPDICKSQRLQHDQI